MKRLISLSLFVLLAFSSTPKLYGIGNDVLRVELFDVENGLSQTAVQDLIQDSFGFLWIGTQNGLNRYDGYGFKVYRNQPLDTTSIANDYITSICEDRNRNVWIGTSNGLCLYNRKTDSFVNFFHNPQDETSISSNRIFSIYEDKFGILWIKTPESLDRFNPDSQTFTRYSHFVDVFSHVTENNDFSIFEDSKNQLWVGTRDGLMLFDRHLGLFKRFSHDPQNPLSLSSNQIKHIYEDSNGNLWISTASGINLFREKTNDFVRYVHNPRIPNSLPNNIVNILFEDSNGTFWVGTDMGICHFFHQKGEFSPLINTFFHGKYLYSATVTSIIEDRSNIIWIGTLSGLVKLDTKSQNFKSYSKSPDGSNLFSGNYVSSIFKNHNGDIWVGTWGTGLHIFNRESNRNVRFFESSASHPICNDYVHVIYKKNNGRILIGTRNGIQVYHEDSKSFTNFFTNCIDEADRIFSQNRVYSIIEDGFGNVWFATRMGLHKYTGNSFSSFYNNPNNPNSISSNEVHALAIDKDGYIWAGTFDGLNRFDPKTGMFEKFLQDKSSSGKSLLNSEIVSLRVDSTGDLWVGTVSGLHRFNSKSQTFTLFTERDGLPNNLIYSIEEDNRGNIWLSTNWGLAMIDLSTKFISTYGVNDGLQSYEFNIGSSFKGNDGELFFGGTNGFNSFYPDSIILNTTIPLMAITNVELFGPKGRKFIMVQGVDELVIDQDFSYINIEFAALDFSRPEKNKYMYMMEGLDNNWVELGNKHSSTFSNLREGVYYFRVKGSNNDNIWNNEGVTLKIIVKTQFWKSKIAFRIYVLLIIASIFIFLRVRTRILRETSRLLKEREQSMEEIEKQKEELLVKNKSITDSIHYAKRIQQSLIPTEERFRGILPDSFILYLPKDIVSGDFYWINETHNKIFVAVIDCTGHGVPGAFMSIIGVELLRNITNIQGINDAAEILNRLSKGVHDTFRVGIDQMENIVKDGMDVSFCVLDKENNTLEFAGAFSNLYIIRESKIIEIKGDRFSVGMHSEQEKVKFQSHFIPVEQDDMIYMFTDGYVDQFGGVEGKKYKFRRFRHLLLNIHKLPFEEQKEHLLNSMTEWRGDREQVDDILIIGIKPDLSCFF
jgi:ligand-binding sensor domain-containing protein/serine phosphatase RsbU (regulator of sigma subunit)